MLESLGCGLYTRLYGFKELKSHITATSHMEYQFLFYSFQLPQKHSIFFSLRLVYLLRHISSFIRRNKSSADTDSMYM